MSAQDFVCALRRGKSGAPLGSGCVVGYKSKQVFVLTAGHVVCPGGAPISPRDMRIHFQSGGSLPRIGVCQEILGYAIPNANNAFLDYALLLVRMERANDLKITNIKKLQALHSAGVQFRGYGMQDFGGGLIGLSPFSGEIEGAVYPNQQNRSHWYLKTRLGQPAQHGHSGAPLLQESGGQQYLVGIHTLGNKPQPKTGESGKEALALIGYATPILRVFEDCPEFQKVCSAPTPWFAMNSLNKLGLPPQPTKKERTILELNAPDSEESLEALLSSSAALRLEHSIFKVGSVMKSCRNWLGNGDPIGSKGFVVRRLRRGHGSNWRKVIFSELSPSELETLRVVIDCASGIPDLSWEDLDLDSSHGLLLALLTGAENPETERGRKEISISNPDGVIRILERIEDILLDINVFHLIPSLASIFKSSNDRREFEKLKRTYLLGCQDAHKTISSAARNKDGRVDAKILEELWSDFIDNVVFPGIFESDWISQNVSFDPAQSEDRGARLHSALECLPKLRGQTSPAQLDRALIKFIEKWKRVPRHLFLGIIVRRPEDLHQEKALLGLFRFGVLHLKKVAFFPPDRVRHLLRWGNYVEIVPISLHSSHRQP